MQRIGLYVAIAGLASIVLSFLNMNLKVLLWIDMWGVTMGWIIRVGLLVVGIAIYVIGGKSTAPQQEQQATE